MTQTAEPEVRPQPDQPSPRAWREVYTLSGMRGVSFAGDIIAATAITLQLQAQGAGSYAVMALLLAATVPPVLLSPVTGRFADRFDSRRLIVTVAMLQALVCLAMTQSSSPVALIGLSVLLSTGLAFTHPVFAALPAAIVGKENVPRASSISQTTAMAGMVAAPGIAGFLTGHFGLTIPLVLDALSFGAVAVGGMLITTRLHGRGAGATAPSADQAGPTYRITADRFLVSLLALSGAVMAAASIINVLIVFYVRGTFGALPEVYGLIMSSWMVGLVPGGLLVRRVRTLSHERVLIGSFLCIAVAILGTALAPAAWWIAPFYLLGGIGNGAQATLTHILLNTRIPQSHRGRAFAALGAVSNSGPAIGFLAGGVLLGFMAPRFGFLIAGGLAAGALLLLSRGVLRSAPADTSPRASS